MKSLSSKTYQCGVTIQGLTTLSGTVYLTGITNTASWDHVIVGTTAQGQIYTRTYAQFMGDVATGISLSSYVTGSGTTNYLSKFTGGSALGNSQIFDNGTNVGIGTASPSTKLHVVGTVTATAIQLNTGSGDYYINGSSNTLRIGSLTTGNKIQLELFHAVNPVSLGISYNGGQALPYIESVHPSYDVNTHLLFKPGGGENWRIGSHGSDHIYGSAFAIKPASNTYDFYLANSSGTALFYSDTSTGYVGIGTTNPVQRLHVNGNIYMPSTNFITWNNGDSEIGGLSSGYGIRFSVYDGSATMVERMRIISTGNVGIGTTSPTAKLEIAGFSTGAGLKLNYGNSSGTIEAVNFIANGGANGIIGMQMVSAGVGDLWLGGSGGRSLTLYRDGNIGIGTTSPISKLHVADTGESVITIQDLDGTNQFLNIGHNGGSSYFLSRDNISNGNFSWYTYDGTTLSTRMYIAPGGNVGIGTTTPTYKLSVLTTGTLGFSLTTYNSTVGNPQIDLYDATRSQETVISSTDGTTTGTYLASYSNHPLLFGTYAATTPTARMAILPNGNVGIGTSSPGYKLQVNGDGNGLYVLGANTAPYTQTIASFVYGGNGNSINIENQGGKASIQARAGGSTMDLLLNPAGSNVVIGTTTPFTIGGTAKVSIYADAPSTYGLSSTDAVYLRRYGVGEYQFQTTASGGNNGNLSLQSYGGSVGIGTTSPAQKLDVAGGDIILSSNATYIRSKDASGNTPRMFGINPSNDTYIGPIDPYAGGAVFYGVSANVASQTFYTGATARLHITSGGNVGIGTTSPSYPLHVNGTTYITSPTYTGYLMLSHGANGAVRVGNQNGDYMQIGPANIFTFNRGITATSFNVTNAGTLSAGASYQGTIFNTSNFIASNTGINYGLQIISNYSNNGAGGPNYGRQLRLSDTLAVTNIQLDFTNLYIDTTLNYTGTTTTGIVRGIHYNPTLTSVVGVTHRAIEIVTGDVIFGSTSGNVGIGTTTPAAKLHTLGTGVVNIVQSSTSVSYTQYYNSSTGAGGTSDGLTVGNNGLNAYVWQRESADLLLGTSNTEAIRITSTQNVGIGTASPSQKLEVSGALVVGMTTPAPFWNALFKDYSDGSGVYISSVNGGGGKYIAGNAYYYNSTLWRSDKTVASAINLDNGTVVFYTNSGLTANTDFTPTERMRITTAGNVGIGSVLTESYALSDRLRVRGGAIQVMGEDVANVRYRTLIASPLDFRHFYIDVAANTANQVITYFGKNINGTETDFMTILDGNVGIGTTSPSYPLDVRSSTQNTTLQIQNAGSAGLGTSTAALRFANADSYSSTFTLSNGGITLNTHGNVSPFTVNGTLTVSGVITATGGNSTNWNTAYGWGNHASASYVPQARTLTINGTSYDLSANRTWTIATSGNIQQAADNGKVTTAASVGTTVITTVATATYDGATFNYVLKDGTNYRAGTIIAVWSAGAVQFNETTTNDIGSTVGVTFAVALNAGNAELRATSATSGWTVKVVTIGI